MKATAKLLCLVMVIVFIITASLTGCGKTETPAPSETSAATDTATAEATPAAPSPTKDFVELNFYFPAALQKDQDAVQAELDKYLKEKLNCSLKLMPQDWSVWSTKYPVLLQSGEQVDLMFSASWSQYVQNVGKNAFLPLDDLLNQYGQGIKSVINPVYLPAATIKGKIYSIPANKDIGQSTGFFFMKDITDKYGIDVNNIKGFDDLTPILQAVKEKEPKLTPFYMNKGHNPENRLLKSNEMLASDKYEYTSNFRYLAFDKAAKKFVYAYELPEIINRAKIVRDWFQKGYINQDALTAQTGEADMMKAGKTFMLISTSQPGQTEFWKTRTNYDVVMHDNGDGLVSTDGATGSVVAIGRTSKDPARSMMVLDLGYTDKYLWNLINFGIENTHYAKVDDKTIKLPSTIAKWSDSTYNPGIAWEFGNQFLSFLKDTDDPQKFTKLDEYNKQLKSSIMLGFVFDTEPVKTEAAAVNNVWEQYNPIIGCGALDADKTIKEMTDKMKASGIDKMITEFQRQYDEWAAAKK